MSMEILAGISMIGCIGAGVALRCARNEIAFLRAENATIAGELARWTDRDARGRFVKRERV